MRRIPLSRRSHVTGYGCFGSGAIEHESALERDFVILTSFADPDAVISQIAARSPVTPLRGSGKAHEQAWPVHACGRPSQRTP